MKRAAAFVIDLLVLVAVCTAVFVVITGGGVYVLAGIRLSLRRVAAVSWFVIDEETVDRLGYAEGVVARGYRELPRTAGSSYRVFGR